MFKALFLIIISFSLYSVSLEDFLLNGDKGDFAVYYKDKSYTLLHLASKSPNLLLEEISTSNKQKNWKEWVANGAKDHTSWMMIELDISSGDILECYSFSRRAFLQSDQSFVKTLLKRPLLKTPTALRKKIGQRLSQGEDHRKIWNPPYFFEGKRRKGQTFQAYNTSWPKDKSPLSNLPIDLYFTNNFPFPYWIQVNSTIYMFKMHVFDSGKNLISPFRTIPRRKAHFAGPLFQKNNQCYIPVTAPAYYKEFELYAYKMGRDAHLTPKIPCKLENKQLVFDKKYLNEFFEKGGKYHFVMSPILNPSQITESPNTYFHHPIE